MLVGYYDEPMEDGSVGVHVAYEISEQSVPASDGIDIVALSGDSGRVRSPPWEHGERHARI